MDLGNDPCFKRGPVVVRCSLLVIQDSKFLRWTINKNMRILTFNQKPDTPSSDTVTQASIETSQTPVSTSSRIYSADCPS